jgi:PAS domain S-box-containing protein
MGYSREEVIGKNFSEFLSPDFASHFEKNFPHFKEAGEIHDVRFKMLRKDGSVIFVEYDGKIGYDEMGNFKQTHCIFHDITEKYEMEKALKTSFEREHLLAELIRNASMAVSVGYADGSIGIFNNAFLKLTGYSEKELKQMGWNGTLTPEEWREMEQNYLQEIQKTKKPVSYEKEYLKKDGSRVPVELVVTPYLDVAGNIESYFAFINDITDRKKVESNLIESESILRGLFDNSPSGIAVYDVKNDGSKGKDYIIKEFNKAALKTEGKKIEDVIGKSLFDLRPNIDQYGLIDIFKKVWETGETTHYPAKVYVDDKYYNWYENHVFKIPNGEIVAIYEDVTAQKMAEEALKSSEERLNLTLNAVNVGIWDWDVPSGNAVFSPKYYTMLGYEPYEFPQNYDSWRNLVHPEDIGFVEQEIQKKIATNGNYSIEMRMKTKSGQWRWISTEGKVVEWDHNRAPVRMVGTHKDITGRIGMEKALTESEEKYRTLFNANPDYTFLMGPDGKIKDVNGATIKIIGLSKEEILGITFSDLGMKLDCDLGPYMDKIGRALKGKQIDPFETEITDINGYNRWLNIFTSIIEKEGSISYILIIARDITLEKKISKEIKDSLREKEVLLQEIHHRVKNNMQIISSLMSLQTKYVDDEVSLDVLKESQNRVKSMALVHEKLYRSEDLTHINIYNYINNLVLDLFFSYGVLRDQIIPIIDIEEIKLNIETAVPCGLIINELVSNVLKHAFSDKKNGKMWLSFHLTDDNQIELIVKDNGSGLPDDFNLDSSNSLGMQLVISLVNQLDGSIKINRADGTEFNIQFKELIYANRI